MGEFKDGDKVNWIIKDGESYVIHGESFLTDYDFILKDDEGLFFHVK